MNSLKKYLIYILVTIIFSLWIYTPTSAATCVEYNDDATCAEYYTETVQRCTMKWRRWGSRCYGSFDTQVWENCYDIYGMTPAWCGWVASIVEITTNRCKRYNNDATCKSYRVDWGWTSWSYGSRWSCNSSTGKQSRNGTRSCTNPSPAWWGSYCSWSSSTTQTRNCRVNGWWSSRNIWAWWSCNSSTGRQSRTDTRSCTNPSPKNGWSSCSGSSTRVISQNCRVDWGWTSWNYSSWWSCNSSTGIKYRTGTRSCTNPSPKNGWSYCSGSSTYTDSTTCPVTGRCGSTNNSCSVWNFNNTSDSGWYSRWRCVWLNWGWNDTCAYRTDYSAPTWTVSYSPSWWTNGNVIVTVSCSDSGWSWCRQSTYSTTVWYNQSWYITISDNLWNSRNISYNVTNIDKITPTGNVSHDTSWYNTSKTITFWASDSWWSKVKRIWLQRSLNGWSYSYIWGTDYNNLSTSSISRSYTQWASNNMRYKYRLIVWDNAGNYSYNYGPNSELKFDTLAPNNPTISSSSHQNNVWTNNINPYFTISENGEWPSPATNYYCFDTNDSCDPNISWNNKNYSNISDGIHYFRAKTCDTGGCSWISSFQINIDTVQPNAGDISAAINYPADWDNLHANNREFSYDVNDNWYAPIIRIEWYLEDANTPDTYSTIQTSNTDNLTFVWDVRKVDNDLLVTDWKRMYTFVITKLSDSAWNTLQTTTATPIKTFKYYIYANPDSTLNTTVSVNQLNQGNVANGQEQDLILNISDEFWNRIIPVWDIWRTIDFVFNIQNNLKLNQYNPNTSESSIFIKVPKTWSDFNNTIFDTGDNRYSNLDSSSWEYNFKYRVYTPTFDVTENNGQELVNGNARINNIKININQDNWVNLNTKTSFDSNVNITSWIDFDYRPMIKSEFQWDFSKNYSINQDLENQIGIITDWYRTISNGKMYLGFGFSDSGLNKVHDNLDIYINWNQINEWHNNAFELWNLTQKIFESEIKQTKSGLSDTEKLHYISTHIWYRLDGNNIVYDWDIIWKTNYSAWTAIDSSSNLWVKILWLTQSKNQTDISNTQSNTDIFQVGNNTKADLKEQMRKNVAEITGNITPKNISVIQNIWWNTWDSSLDAPKLSNKKILLTTWEVKLSSIQNYTGNKTLVIQWWNLYITQNLLASNKVNDILWIIVLEDETWYGWNVYIDPTITAIEAIIYADKSVLNYNGTDIITDSNQLENQIYFYWTLFSENTLWWYISKKCPYFEKNCSYEIAKKYDLNFLRWYYTFDWDNDGLEDESNGSSYFSYPDTNFKYPVIIEYNPNIQNNPPELFEIQE